MSWAWISMSPIQRLMMQIAVDENGCWVWQGATNKGGYGRIHVNKKPIVVHRFAYEFYKGTIPPGLEVDHLCRVPQCCNPDHLEAVTKGENMRRAWSHSPHRRVGFCGRCRAVLDGKATFYCRACAREVQRAWKERVRARLLV